ncbi:MAG: ABC transporter permease [Actinomycetota bacterium]
MTVLAAPPGTTLRSGPRYWWDSYRMMLRWEMTSLRMVLVIAVIVQILTGAGFVLALGLFFGQVPPRAALFVSTGVLVVTLVTIGLVLGPQLVAMQKAEKTYDFLWSLPVPRTTAALAWVTTNLVLGLPGMAVALGVALLRYDLDLHVSWAIVPAVLLTLFTGTMVGYALAHALGNPMLIAAITQMLIFVIIGFSPINFPADQLPGWLAAAHRWLPLAPMADTVRAGLTRGVVEDVARSYLVLGAWAAASIGISAAVLGRRG